MVKRFQSWRWPTDAGAPKAVHEWERSPMDEELLTAICRGEAGTRNAVVVAHCECGRVGEITVSIDFRSLAPYFAEAERAGGYVKWRLRAADGEVARIWNRQMSTAMIPAEDRRSMVKRMRELDPTSPGLRASPHLVAQLRDPGLSPTDREELIAAWRDSYPVPDSGRLPTTPPKTVRRSLPPEGSGRRAQR